jgi:hypothetical protein
MIFGHSKRMPQPICTYCSWVFSHSLAGGRFQREYRESVYAALEIKQVLNKENMAYAANKIASVHTLHHTTAPSRRARWA